MRAVQWVSADSIPCKVYMPDGSVAQGLAESALLNEKSDSVQFERFGFVRIESRSKDGITAVYTHD